MSYNNPIDPAKIDPRTGLYRLPDKKLFFNVQIYGSTVYLNLKKRNRFFGSKEVDCKDFHLYQIPHTYRTIEEGLLLKSQDIVLRLEQQEERRQFKAQYEGDYPPRKLGSIT